MDHLRDSIFPEINIFLLSDHSLLVALSCSNSPGTLPVHTRLSAAVSEQLFQLLQLQVTLHTPPLTVMYLS